MICFTVVPLELVDDVWRSRLSVFSLLQLLLSFKSLTNLEYYPRRQCDDSRQMALDIRDQTQQTNFIQTP